jgi:hypothetical protein
LENLFKRLHLESKLFYHLENIKDEHFRENIDYEKVHQLLEKEKEESLKFLKNNLFVNISKS